MQKFILVISSGLGTGYSPVASGTVGSLPGLLVALIFAWRRGYNGFRGLDYLAACLVVFIVGVWASGRAEQIYGEKDSRKIVIDEVAGMMLTLYMLPATPLYFALGFFLFRFFDVVKPFPARRIDMRMKGGWGVMLDDVAAAAYANLCLQLFRAAAS